MVRLTPPTCPVTCVCCGKPDRGFRLAAARNLGADAATGDLLVFLDADTTPEPGYLRRLTRLPALVWDCVTVGRRRHAQLDGVDCTSDIEVIAPDNELEEPRWLLEAYQRTNNLLAVDHRSYRYVIGAVLACSRRFFRETGGFDETFTAYGGEDWEWAYRMWLQERHSRTFPTRSPGTMDRIGLSAPPATSYQRMTKCCGLLNSFPFQDRGGVPWRRPVSTSPSRPPGTRHPGAGVCQHRLRARRPSRCRCRVTRGAGGFPTRSSPSRSGHGTSAPSPAGCPGADHRRDRRGEHAEVVVRGRAGEPLLRVVSVRARNRQERWGGAQLLPTIDVVSAGIVALAAEVDLEAYLGGWG